MLSCCDFRAQVSGCWGGGRGGTKIGRKVALVKQALGHLTPGVLLSVVLIVALLQIIHHCVVTVALRCVVGHGRLLVVVPPRLRLLPVRGGEEEHRGGQGDQEGPPTAEKEGEEGD